MEGDQLLIGAMADRLETKYGDETLKRFAAEIGVKVGKVERWRSVYRWWKGKTNPAAQPDSQSPPESVFDRQSPSVLKILQGHPDAEIAEEIVWGPRLTTRQAQTHVDDYRLAHPAPAPALEEDWRVRDARPYYAGVLKVAAEASTYKFINENYLDREVLIKSVNDPEQLIATLDKGIEGLAELRDKLKRTLAPPPPPMFDDAPPETEAPNNDALSENDDDPTLH